MADDLKIPSFSRVKKLKKESVTIKAPLPTFEPIPLVPSTVAYNALTDEDIESCRKGQDIFEFARDIEDLVRVKNKI